VKPSAYGVAYSLGLHAAEIRYDADSQRRIVLFWVTRATHCPGATCRNSRFVRSREGRAGNRLPNRTGNGSRGDSGRHLGIDSRPDSAEDSRAKLHGLSRCDSSCDSLPDVHSDSHGHRQGELNRDSGRDSPRHLQDDLRVHLRRDLWRDLSGLSPAKLAVRLDICGLGLLGLTMTRRRLMPRCSGSAASSMSALVCSRLRCGSAAAQNG
jgi:hypothetical protein